MYTQCELRSDDSGTSYRYQLAWIDSTKALADALVLPGTPEPNRVWQVFARYQSVDFVPHVAAEIRNHRRNTGDGLPKL